MSPSVRLLFFPVLPIIRALRPLQQVIIRVAGGQQPHEPAIPDDIAQLLSTLGRGH